MQCLLRLYECQDSGGSLEECSALPRNKCDSIETPPVTAASELSEGDAVDVGTGPAIGSQEQPSEVTKNRKRA